MSDYEVLMVFYEVTDDLNGVFTLYLSMIGAFLFLGLFFAQVLNRLMTGIIIFIYLSMMSGVVTRMVEACAMFERVVGEMGRRTMLEDSGLAWIGEIRPDFVLQSFSETTAFTLTLAIIASIIFFFQTSKIDPKDLR